MEPKGLIHVYTGDGKGKTTAALGLCLRAIGQGRTVAFIQFLKGSSFTGELFSSARFDGRWHFAQFGWGCPYSGMIRTGQATCNKCGQCFRENRDPRHAFASMAFEYVKKLARTGQYQMLVLDEISHALRRNLLLIEEVVDFLCTRPAGLEIVLTGRDMAQEIINLADVVTENRPVKHPYTEGVPSRRGIEY